MGAPLASTGFSFVRAAPLSAGRPSVLTSSAIALITDRRLDAEPR